MFDGDTIRRQPRYRSTLRLHHVLQDFKHTQEHKSALSNKINVLKMHYDANKKRTKNINNSIIKISEVKQHYRLQKQQMSQHIMRQKENYHRKIEREREKRQNSKDNLQIIRNSIVQQKQKEYLKIKEKERINQLAITQNFQRSLHEKRQRSLQMKLQEEQLRLSKTIFLEKKRIRALRQAENDMRPLEVGLDMNERYLRQMKQLQDQMVKKLEVSRQNLSKSKLTFSKVAT